MFSKFTKAKSGYVSGSFDLSDLITKFSLSVDAVSGDGLYGFAKKEFSTKKDFYMVADMPFTMAALDKLDVPVTIFNNMDHQV